MRDFCFEKSDFIVFVLQAQPGAALHHGAAYSAPVHQAFLEGKQNQKSFDFVLLLTKANLCSAKPIQGFASSARRVGASFWKQVNQKKMKETQVLQKRFEVLMVEVVGLLR